GLCEHVVQVVADTDESEALVEELANARSAEEEKAEYDVVLARVFDQALRGGVQLGRSVHVGEFVFFIEAHGHAKVVLAEEENVHTGHSGDLGYVLDAVGGFNLQGDDGVVVPVAGVAKQPVLVHAALREIDGASAGRRILGAANGLAGFGRGVYVGDEHAIGPEIERLLDAAAVVIALHAEQRFRAAAGNS